MIVNVTNTTVTLSWMSPDPPNGIIRSYQVQYSISDHDNYNSIDTNTNALTYTVTGLTPGTKYDFRVRGETITVGSMTRGPPSNVVTTIVGKLECYATNECEYAMYVITKAQTNSHFSIQAFF